MRHAMIVGAPDGGPLESEGEGEVYVRTFVLHDWAGEVLIAVYNAEQE